MAATSSNKPQPRSWPGSTSTAQQVAGLIGGVGGALGGGAAHAVDLPPDHAEAMIHVYEGGGVTAAGPALLIRKSMADRVSLSASYYVDAVSNASIDVVTTASAFKETRNAYELGVDYVVRDSQLTVSVANSKEPDYIADGINVDATQEVFGGMTTVALGFTRGADQVGQKDRGFFDEARHWQYRLGVTQILSPTWLASANWEAVSDAGFLGSPYRAAREFGASVPERNPRTRSSRAIKLRVLGEVSTGAVVRAEYRYFWDNWDIHAHTIELGHSRYFGEIMMGEAFVRAYLQSKALFYSDDAAVQNEFVSRNRQLATFNSFGFGAKVSYLVNRVPGKYEVKLNGGYEFKRFAYKDFTDVRTGNAFAFTAHLLQGYVSATF